MLSWCNDGFTNDLIILKIFNMIRLLLGIYNKTSSVYKQIIFYDFKITRYINRCHNRKIHIFIQGLTRIPIAVSRTRWQTINPEMRRYYKLSHTSMFF